MHKTFAISLTFSSTLIKASVSRTMNTVNKNMTYTEADDTAFEFVSITAEINELCNLLLFERFIGLLVYIFMLDFESERIHC